MKEITGFKCTDGKIFEFKHEANKHQDHIDIEKRLFEILDSELFDLYLSCTQKDDLVEAMLKHKGVLLSALSIRNC